MKQKLRQLLSEGKTRQVIDKLLEATLNQTELYGEVILQSARFEEYSKAKRLGAANLEEGEVILAKINNALLEIIGQLPDKFRPKAGKIPVWIAGSAILLIVLAGIGFGVENLFSGHRADAFSVTVFVHGKDGRDDRILRNQGKVVLDIGSARQEASINEKGEATFKELPASFIGKKALLSIDHPQPYFPVDRNSEYVLETGAPVYLEVELVGIHKIQGRVLDFETEKPLDSVRVSVQNAAAYSDKFGWFELQIPPAIQAKFLKVTFFREKYKMVTIDSIAPHTRQEIGVLLKKEE